MAVMTAEERAAFTQSTGWTAKTKCDHCNTPIASVLSFRGTKGREYCKRSCLATAEPEQVVSHYRKEKTMADEVKPKKKKAAAEPKKEKPAAATHKKEKKEKKEVAANKTSRNPFRAGSAIAEAWEMCYAGTTKAKLLKFCEAQEVGPTRVFACMKAGAYGEEKWKYKEDESGNIKIVFLKAKA